MIATTERAQYLCSWPASGRTWLRYILSHYFNRIFALALDVDLNTMFAILPNEGKNVHTGLHQYQFPERRDIPLIVASHRQYLPKFFKGRSVIRLIRNPLDTLVSGYRECIKNNSYDDSIQQFAHSHHRGLVRMAYYMNRWAIAEDLNKVMIVSYEQMMQDCSQCINRIIKFLDIPLDRHILASSIERSARQKMRALEKSRGLGRKDQTTNRIRNGGVGFARRFLDKGQREAFEDMLKMILNDEAKHLFAAYCDFTFKPIDKQACD